MHHDPDLGHATRDAFGLVDGDQTARAGAMVLTLSSPAFTNRSRIPATHTCDGQGASPLMRWMGAPAGARSFAILCADPDAPRGTWWHWAVYDIATDEAGIPEAYPKGSKVGGCRQATNDFGYAGYGGPCPPKGHGTHHYQFRLLALDVEELQLVDEPHCTDIEAAARGHTLASAELIGTYSR